MPPRKRPADSTTATNASGAAAAIFQAAKKPAPSSSAAANDALGNWQLLGPKQTLYARAPTSLPAAFIAALAAHRSNDDSSGSSGADAEAAGAAPKLKVAAFDMDGTLLVPKSGAPFPRDRFDWQWWSPHVAERLKELHNEGYAIVIFSNQAGVSKKKQSASDLTGKIDDVVTATGGLPIAAYFAIDSDHYRKPCPGMWYQYLDHLRVLLPSWHHAAISQDAAGLVSLSDSNGDSNSNSNCAVPPALSSWVDTAASFFCGDAAGRTAPTAPTAHSKDWRKDHSDADRCFAGNAALPFVVPEQVLLPAGRVSAAGPAKGSWAVKAGAGAGVATAALADRAVIEQYARQNGAAVVASKEVVDRLIATGPGAATRSNSNAPGGDGDESKTSDGNDALEVVVMVGAPACGKSTIARALCALPAAYGHSGVAASADSVVGAAAYEWVNQDTLKTKEKCAAAVAAALKQGRNVVVDNTNPTAETRALYTRAAKMAAAAIGRPVRLRCVFVAAPKAVAMHMLSVRACVSAGAAPHVPGIAVNMFYSKLETPAKAEGFDEVLYVPWEPVFPAKPDSNSNSNSSESSALGGTALYSDVWPLETVFNWYH